MADKNNWIIWNISNICLALYQIMQAIPEINVSIAMTLVAFRSKNIFSSANWP
jgi:hypothetical protein